MMKLLSHIRVQNFKSLRDQSIDLGRLNLLIGANGSGKSNFIEVFRLLQRIVDRSLQSYIMEKGGAESLLYFGMKESRSISIYVRFDEFRHMNAYEVTLQPNAAGSMFLANETVFYQDKDRYSGPYDDSLSSNVLESELANSASSVALYVKRDLAAYRVYHFHDTSDSARMKHFANIDDNSFLRPQAENIAPFLFYLSQRHRERFELIQHTIRQVAPFFDRFDLSPSRINPSQIRLEWRERGSDHYFNASHLSDGTLRFVCLATLLLQPNPPSLILLDEPELGLHPSAINLLATLLSATSEKVQLIVSTQSVTLINQFGPESIWTVEREDRQTVIRRLDSERLAGWLESYSLGELWEKNLLGARP